MKINISENQFNKPPVTEGVYDVVAVNMTRKDSQSGNLCAYIQFQIQDGEFEGEKVLGMLVCLESVLWKSNQLIKAVTGDDIPEMGFENENEFLDWVWEQVNGVPLRVKATERMYKEEMRLELEYLTA